MLVNISSPDTAGVVAPRRSNQFRRAQWESTARAQDVDREDAPHQLGQALEHIADRAGFSDPQVMRLHFKRVVGMPPTAYQRSFR